MHAFACCIAMYMYNGLLASLQNSMFTLTCPFSEIEEQIPHLTIISDMCADRGFIWFAKFSAYDPHWLITIIGLEYILSYWTSSSSSSWVSRQFPHHLKPRPLFRLLDRYPRFLHPSHRIDLTVQHMSCLPVSLPTVAIPLDRCHSEQLLSPQGIAFVARIASTIILSIFARTCWCEWDHWRFSRLQAYLYKMDHVIFSAAKSKFTR